VSEKHGKKPLTSLICFSISPVMKCYAQGKNSIQFLSKKEYLNQFDSCQPLNNVVLYIYIYIYIYIYGERGPKNVLTL
jgi:hypothetical protein